MSRVLHGFPTASPKSGPSGAAVPGADGRPDGSQQLGSNKPLRSGFGASGLPALSVAASPPPAHSWPPSTPEATLARTRATQSLTQPPATMAAAATTTSRCQ